MRFPHARLGALLIGLAGCSAVLGLEELHAGATPDGVVPVDAGAEASTGDAGVAERVCRGCEVVASGEPSPTELAEIGSRLAWIRFGPAGNVVAAGRDGGAIAIGSPTSPLVRGHDLKIAEGYAYAVGEDGVLRRFLDASSCEDAAGVTRLGSFGGEFLVVKTGSLSRGGCGGRTIIVKEDVVAVTGDPPYAWFARRSGDVVRCKADRAECASTLAVIASAQGDVRALANDPSHVVWATATETGAEIRSAPKAADGAAPALVAASSEVPKTIVAVDGRVYWTESASGRVLEAPITGGAAPSVLASGLAGPWGLVVTASEVYFTESTGGRIVKLPR